MIYFLILPLMLLGRLQGSGSLLWIPDWLRSVLKHSLSGLIITAAFTYEKLDYSTWVWWQFVLVITTAILCTWVGETRGHGWIKGWWVRGWRGQDDNVDGWMKFIPTHKLPTEFLQKIVTTLVRGWFWGALMFLIAWQTVPHFGWQNPLYIDSMFWHFWWAYPVAILMANWFGKILQDAYDDMTAWTWSEYLRHPFAFILLLI